MYFPWNIAVRFSACFVISESLRENNFSIKSGKTIDVPSALMEKIVVGTLIECACRCGAEPDCTHGVFRSDDGQCRLYAANETISLNKFTTDTVIVKCGIREFRTETGYDVRHDIRNSDLDTIDLQFVLFDVKTYERIYLDFYQQTTWAFGVGLGTNGGLKSLLYLRGSAHYFYHDTPLYNCTSYKRFWITWNTTTVEVGAENIISVNSFLHHTTANVIPTIGNMKIVSYYNGTTYWVFASQGDRCD